MCDVHASLLQRLHNGVAFHGDESEELKRGGALFYFKAQLRSTTTVDHFDEFLWTVRMAQCSPF